MTASLPLFAAAPACTSAQGRWAPRGEKFTMLMTGKNRYFPFGTAQRRFTASLPLVPARNQTAPCCPCVQAAPVGS